MLPLIALAGIAAKLFPIVEAVPEVAKALNGGRSGEAVEKVLEVAKKVTGIADPERAADAIIKDPALQLEYQKQLSEERKFFAELEFKREQLYVGDTQDARKAHAGDDGVYWLGVVILVTFAVICSLAMYGAYKLLLDDSLKFVDPGVVAAVATFVGAVMGYVASNAQQVVSYFFGSSRGAQDHASALSASVTKLVKRGD